MKKILITFGTRPLAMRIAKRLGADFEILYASSEDIPELLLASGKYAKIPKGLLPTFAHEILKLSLDQQVDYVLPLGGFEGIIYYIFVIQILTSPTSSLHSKTQISQVGWEGMRGCLDLELMYSACKRAGSRNSTESLYCSTELLIHIIVKNSNYHCISVQLKLCQRTCCLGQQH